MSVFKESHPKVVAALRHKKIKRVYQLVELIDCGYTLASLELEKEEPHPSIMEVVAFHSSLVEHLPKKQKVVEEGGGCRARWNTNVNYRAATTWVMASVDVSGDDLSKTIRALRQKLPWEKFLQKSPTRVQLQTKIKAARIHVRSYYGATYTSLSDMEELLEGDNFQEDLEYYSELARKLWEGEDI